VPIAEVETIWMNGELVPWHEAKVHVLSHALHYGSGVFEGIRAYETSRGPAVWHLDAHLGRMYDSAAIYHMEIPYSKEQLVRATKDVIRANDLPACYIRPIAFRGYGEIGVNPLANPVDVSIAVWPWGAYLGEAALALRRGCFIALGRARDLDEAPTALVYMPLAHSSCHSFTPGIAERAERVHGTSLEFSRTPDALLADLL